MNNSEQKTMNVFTPYIDVVQIFVDEHIVGTTTMTAKEIAEGFFQTNTNCLLTGSDFVDGFRLAIREGLIIGLEGAQRKGYKRAGVVLPKAVTISPEDWDTIRYRLQLTSSDGLPEVLAALEAVAPMIEAAVIGVSALKKVSTGGSRTSPPSSQRSWHSES